GRGIAFGKPPCAAAASEHKLLAVEPPCGGSEGRDTGLTTGLHYDLVSVLGASGCVGEGEPAERLVELAHDLPLAEDLVRAADLGLERRLGLHEVETLALALGLENTALDLGKFEQRNPVAVDESQNILRAKHPGHDLLERNDGAGR